MLAALRYRRAQTLVVVVLAALVTTVVLAPLYTRALEQAMIRTMLHEATAGRPASGSGPRAPPPPGRR